MGINRNKPRTRRCLIKLSVCGARRAIVTRIAPQRAINVEVRAGCAAAGPDPVPLNGVRRPTGSRSTLDDGARKPTTTAGVFSSYVYLFICVFNSIITASACVYIRVQHARTDDRGTRARRRVIHRFADDCFSSAPARRVFVCLLVFCCFCRRRSLSLLLLLSPAACHRHTRTHIYT